MNKNILTVIGVGALLVIGYVLISNNASRSQSEPTTPTQETADTASPPEEVVTVELSEQNDSGESGTAKLTEVDGKVYVSLSLTGAPADVMQPAHIHVGACPDVGAVKYPLTSPVNGASETVLDVTFDQLRSELPLGINVHKSDTEAKVYVSCGDLALDD